MGFVRMRFATDGWRCKMCLFDLVLVCWLVVLIGVFGFVWHFAWEEEKRNRK